MNHEPDASPSADVAARERDRALARLIPSFVHDMNNKLAVLRGFCELEEASGNALIEPAKRETAAAARLLARLGSLAKDRPPKQETFDLAALVRDLDELLVPFAKAHRVELSIEASGRALVDGDAAGLAQRIVARVVAEVLDAAPRTMRLGVAREGDREVLSLKHDAAPLHDRGRDDGTGAFRLTFDAVEEASTVTDADVARGARILVVERRGDLAEVIAAVLDEAGYRVETVADEAAARRRLDEASFDLVLHGAAGSTAADFAPARGARVARIGEEAAGDEPALRLPARPDELIAFVRGCLA